MTSVSLVPSKLIPKNTTSNYHPQLDWAHLLTTTLWLEIHASQMAIL